MIIFSDLNKLFKPPLNATTVPSNTRMTGVCIDSRKVKPGDLFVAICGESFDGHDFVAQAVAQGAAAVLCSRILPGIEIPQWVVADTVMALADIATFYRQQFTCPVVALTGSNGKTTVKEMVASILPKPSLPSQGNFNNHIGVPLSVFALNQTHRYAVFELGANHLGEIAHTVAIVKPQVALINNIAPAHLEGFGSIDGVAKAKGEIYQGLAPGGTAIINDDDAYAHFWDASLAGHAVLRYSSQKTADVYAKAITYQQSECARFLLFTPAGSAWVHLKVPGAHNVQNALAAAACATALQIDLATIAAALSNFGGVAGRMTYRQGKNNALIIDDTYNANLRSTIMAINVLSQRPGKRIFVFGDMGELGEMSLQHHQEVGQVAREKGVDKLMTCGRLSQSTTTAFGVTAQHYSNKDNLVEDLLPLLDENTTVLVKGSRSSAMENVVRHLLITV
jgi:UDP-N-acetylmuramoyl-tripeptide--D-alanyl-D-alanine ligase